MNRRQCCLWCGTTAKLTKEHLVPAWLGRELRRQHPDFEIGARYRLGSGEGARVWEDRQPFSIIVKKVCESCNNGWMAQLEAEVKDHLLLLAGGGEHLLTNQAQSIIAAWCFKTACMYDHVGRGAYMPSVHRQEFFDKRVPPSGVVVHLAPRDIGPVLPPIIQHRLRRARFEGVSVGAYKAVFAIGHVIAQVIGFPGYELAGGTEDVAAGATRIWPTASHTIWPGQRRRLTIEDTLAYTQVEITVK